MIKWRIVLDNEALYYQFLSPVQYRKTDNEKAIQLAQNYATQHVIVLTDSLVNNYLNYLIEKDEAIADYFINEYLPMGVSFEGELFTSYESNIEREETADSIIDILNEIQNKGICLCGNKDFYTRMLSQFSEGRVYYCAEMSPLSIHNKITRNSKNFNYDLRKKDYEAYDSWLEEVFTNESRISIIDPYFATKNGLELFINKYLCKFSANTQVKIYTFMKYNQHTETPTDNEWGYLLSDAEKRKVALSIYKIPARAIDRKTHDRRIYLEDSERHITIGHGLDAINWKKQYANDCHISIDDDMTYLTDFLQEQTPERVRFCCSQKV